MTTTVNEEPIQTTRNQIYCSNYYLSDINDIIGSMLSLQKAALLHLEYHFKVPTPLITQSDKNLAHEITFKADSYYREAKRLYVPRGTPANSIEHIAGNQQTKPSYQCI